VIPEKDRVIVRESEPRVVLSLSKLTDAQKCRAQVRSSSDRDFVLHLHSPPMSAAFRPLRARQWV